MRTIDLQTWPRRKHFEVFNGFDYPHFNLCAGVDVTAFFPAMRQAGISFTVGVIYLLAKTANGIPEFRTRIRGQQVVEHEVVHPSASVMAEGDLFSFCTMAYEPDFPAFAEQAARRMAWFQQHPTLEDEPGQDDLLFLSSIPWVSFSGLTHPIHMHPVDSVPRLTWGKIFDQDGRLKMPLSVQGHHALMDGVHVGRFFTQVQAYLDSPQI
jgi:chloramphenicol O-acetyltransferase type A